VNQDVIDIIPEFPESQLLSFLWVLGYGTADRNERMRVFPALRLVRKLSRLPFSALSEGAITEMRDFGLKGLGQFGDNSITGLFFVEKLDECSIVEASIGPGLDRDFLALDIPGNLLAAFFPEFRGNGNGLGISRTKESIPAVLSMVFETDYGVVAGAPMFSGVVPDRGSLDFPTVKGKNRRIQIEDDAGAGAVQIPHPFPEQVVDPDQAIQFLRAHSFQEFPQGRGSRKVGKAQETLERAVVGQDSGIRNSFEAGYHGKKDAKN
jgi:hypothetical protein